MKQVSIIMSPLNLGDKNSFFTSSLKSIDEIVTRKPSMRCRNIQHEPVNKIPALLDFGISKKLHYAKFALLGL